MNTPLIDEAAAKSGPAGRLVAHYFKKFIDDAPIDVIAKDLPSQWRIFMHGFEPKTQEFVGAGQRIDAILTHQAALQLQAVQQPQRAQQKADEEPERMTGSELAAHAIGSAVAAPFHALQSILGLGALGVAGTYNALKNAGKTPTERVDISADALASSVKALSEKPAGSGQKQVGEAKDVMQTSAAEYARSLVAEAKDIIAKGKSGAMTKDDVRDAIETRTTKNDSLLAEAEKVAAAGKNPEAQAAIAKTVESVRVALEKAIEAIMRALKAIFSPTKGSRP